MATFDAHLEKGDAFWMLAQRKCDERATPFLCMNLVMYTVGHYVEALLALKGRHPSSPPRGVPHGDRDALLRRILVADGMLDAHWADTYSEMVASRDTFIDGGVQDRPFIEKYMAAAAPFVNELIKVLKPYRIKTGGV